MLFFIVWELLLKNRPISTFSLIISMCCVGKGGDYLWSLALPSDATQRELRATQTTSDTHYPEHSQGFSLFKSFLIITLNKMNNITVDPLGRSWNRCLFVFAFFSYLWIYQGQLVQAVGKEYYVLCNKVGCSVIKRKCLLRYQGGHISRRPDHEYFSKNTQGAEHFMCCKSVPCFFFFFKYSNSIL